MNDARLWHPWLRINRVLRVMLQTRWSAEAWSVVRIEFRRALALRSEIRRAGWFRGNRPEPFGTNTTTGGPLAPAGALAVACPRPIHKRQREAHAPGSKACEVQG